MIRFFQKSGDTYTGTIPAESRLCYAESEEGGRCVIGYRLMTEVTDWLDEHAPDWNEYESAVVPPGTPCVCLILRRHEHCVAFQLRWG